MRVTVIDYKAGNLTSVLKALRHLGAETVVTDGDLSLVESAERIVLPGVGHFAATERLDATGLTGAIRAATARGVRRPSHRGPVCEGEPPHPFPLPIGWGEIPPAA